MLRYLKIDKSLPWQNISFKSSFARMWFTATSLGVTPKRCRRVAPSAARGHRVLGSLPFRSSSAPGRCQSGGTTKLPHVFLYVLKSIAINKKKDGPICTNPNVWSCGIHCKSGLIRPPLDFGYKWSTCSRWSFGSSLEGDFSAEPYHSKQGRHINNHLSRLDSDASSTSLVGRTWTTGFQESWWPFFFSIQRQQRQNLWGPYNWLASKSKRSWESRAQVFEVTCTGESDSNSEWRAKGRRSQNLNFCYGHFCFHRHCHYYCYCSGSCNYYWHHHYHDWYEHHYTFNIAYNIYIYI